MAKGLKMSVRSVRGIVKEGLGLTAYKFQRTNISSFQEKRLDRAKKMFAEIEHASRKNIIWSDEKKNTVQAVDNVKDEFVYAGSQSEGSRVQFRCQKPAGAMVWAAVVFNGSTSPMFFVDDGVKVNSVVHIKVLAENLVLCVTETYRTHYILPKTEP